MELIAQLWGYSSLVETKSWNIISSVTIDVYKFSNHIICMRLNVKNELHVDFMISFIIWMFMLNLTRPHYILGVDNSLRRDKVVFLLFTKEI